LTHVTALDLRRGHPANDSSKHDGEDDQQADPLGDEAQDQPAAEAREHGGQSNLEQAAGPEVA